MSAGLGVRRGGWRRESDCAWRLSRVVHWQDEPRAADRHVLIRQGQLLIHTFVEPASTGGEGVLVVDGVRAGGVCAHGDVSVHGTYAGVVHDEV